MMKPLRQKNTSTPMMPGVHEARQRNRTPYRPRIESPTRVMTTISVSGARTWSD